MPHLGKFAGAFRKVVITLTANDNAVVLPGPVQFLKSQHCCFRVCCHSMVSKRQSTVIWCVGTEIPAASNLLIPRSLPKENVAPENGKPAGRGPAGQGSGCRKGTSPAVPCIVSLTSDLADRRIALPLIHSGKFWISHGSESGGYFTPDSRLFLAYNSLSALLTVNKFVGAGVLATGAAFGPRLSRPCGRWNSRTFRYAYPRGKSN